MGLLSQSSSSPLGKINHMVGRNRWLGVAINGAGLDLSSDGGKTMAFAKTRNDVTVDILIPALLHQLSEESRVFTLKKGQGGYWCKI